MRYHVEKHTGEILKLTLNQFMVSDMHNLIICRDKADAEKTAAQVKTGVWKPWDGRSVGRSYPARNYAVGLPKEVR